MRLRGGPSRRVFLVGFMASGKSAVGRELARLTGRPFADTDLIVERAARRTIPRLFRERGEAAFRRLEASALSRAARGRAGVVAVGGGALQRPGSARRLRRSGTVVYLQVPIEVLVARARAAGLSKRPLLAAAAAPGGPGARRLMARLLARRRPAYRAAAHLTVRGDAPVAAVAERIRRALSRRRGGR